MPTFNQLVKYGRQDKTYKSKSPALQKGFNSLTKTVTEQSSPQRRGVCTKVSTTSPRSLTRLFVRSRELSSPTALKQRFISPVSATTFRSTLLFSSEAEEYVTFPVCVTTSSAVSSTLRALLTVSRAVLSTVQRDLSNSLRRVSQRIS